MIKKKTASKKKTDEPKLTLFETELITLGHLMKYNLYLLTKAIVFSSLVNKTQSIDDATLQTNQVMLELDLDTKERLKKSNLS